MRVCMFVCVCLCVCVCLNVPTPRTAANVLPDFTTGSEKFCFSAIGRVGQNRIYMPYMAVYLVISLPKIPYIYGSGQP